MPTLARALETIECLEDDKRMAFKLPKALSTNDIDLFFGFGLKVGITDIGSIEFKIIELSKKNDNTKTT